MNDLIDIFFWSFLAAAILVGFIMITVAARSGMSLSVPRRKESGGLMIGDSQMVVQCLCGYGDDGRHVVTDLLGMRCIMCPRCPPGQMYIFGGCVPSVSVGISASESEKT